MKDSSYKARNPEFPPASCPIRWQPSVLMPVFYGVRDFGMNEPIPPFDFPVVRDPDTEVPDISILEAPRGRGRVFFPSLDGGVFHAPILKGCGRYPLLFFCHGQCSSDAEQYKKWFEIPAILARSGNVVIVLPNSASFPPSATDLDNLASVEFWFRNHWKHRSVLLPQTGVIGHSFGGGLAANYAAQSGAAAFASLSGRGVMDHIHNLAIPKFFAWGFPTSDAVEALSSLQESQWADIAQPKHRAVFADAMHWDYLPAGRSICETGRGSCGYTWVVIAELLASFFGKYLPQQHWPNLPTDIPDSLKPPAVPLTTEQQFYAGGRFMGLELFEEAEACQVEMSWVTGNGTGSTTIG